MKVKALQTFISTIHGNVGSGEIIEVSDSYGKMLIQHKLAIEIGRPAEKPVDFTLPVGDQTVPGPSSQAAPASPGKTASESEPGEKEAGRKKRQGKKKDG